MMEAIGYVIDCSSYTSPKCFCNSEPLGVIFGPSDVFECLGMTCDVSREPGKRPISPVRGPECGDSTAYADYQQY